MKERAILVTVDLGRDNSKDSAAELEELAESVGFSVEESFIFKQKTPTAPLFLGKGKAEELGRAVKTKEADAVVFNNNLSHSQQRNIEEIVNAKTIDRTQLILDIFAQRAKSMEGKLQVELAQLKYLLPRLSGKGIYLSRLGGGVGTRGPGEQKLEMDRRRLRDRIVRLTRDLRELQKRRLAGIERKKEKDLPLIALVGYTNAGKSTLFNRLTRANMPVEDKLFSTLDTTTRLLELPGKQKALLVDTVGFVRDLPHSLVESFKATLEEVTHADILLHVMDASRADLSALNEAVRRVLSELGTEPQKILWIFNKMDLLNEAGKEAIGREAKPGSAFISALSGEGVEPLLSEISQNLPEKRQLREFFIPSGSLGLAHFLYDQALVLRRRDEENGAYFTVQISPKIERIFQKHLRTA